MENEEFENVVQVSFCQLERYQQEIIFPFAFINPVGEIATENHAIIFAA
jgi:hypothetical protein